RALESPSRAPPAEGSPRAPPVRPARPRPGGRHGGGPAAPGQHTAEFVRSGGGPGPRFVRRGCGRPSGPLDRGGRALVAGAGGRPREGGRPRPVRGPGSGGRVLRAALPASPRVAARPRLAGPAPFFPVRLHLAAGPGPGLGARTGSGG